MHCCCGGSPPRLRGSTHAALSSAQIKNAVSNSFDSFVSHALGKRLRGLVPGREHVRWCAVIAQGWVLGRFPVEARLRNLQAMKALTQL